MASVTPALAQSSLSFVSSSQASSLRSTFSGTLPKSFARASLTSDGRRQTIVAKAQQEDSKDIFSNLGTGLAAMGLSLALQFSPIQDMSIANASEFNVLSNPAPLVTHVDDDANVLSRVTRSDLRRLLTELEETKGYHIDFVTLRKISGKGDVFELADKILETWYPTLEEGDKRGVVLLVTTAKEGAIAGGPSFIEAVGEDLIEAILSENIPVLATEEKYNESLYSTAKRLVARFEGQEDIPGPQFNDNKRVSNFKSKNETEEKRGQFTTVVGGLLVIAFVVPMLQYFAYTKK